jgi:hypothetical protein
VARIPARRTKILVERGATNCDSIGGSGKGAANFWGQEFRRQNFRNTILISAARAGAVIDIFAFLS